MFRVISHFVYYISLVLLGETIFITIYNVNSNENKEETEEKCEGVSKPLT